MSGTGFSALGSLSWCRICVIVFYCLCRASCANVWQLLVVDGTDKRMPDVVHTLYNASLLSCGVKCSRSTVCLAVNYHRASRTCELSSSSGHDTEVVRISAFRWTVYRQKHDCPNSAIGFTKVGSMVIKLCPELVTWQKATEACSQFGRLVKIDTVAKLGPVVDYLRNYPNDVWINGNLYPNDKWYFEDGSPMSTCGDPDFWASGSECQTEQCVRLKKSTGFKMNDFTCGDRFSYMCELV